MQKVQTVMLAACVDLMQRVGRYVSAIGKLQLNREISPVEVAETLHKPQERLSHGDEKCLTLSSSIGQHSALAENVSQIGVQGGSSFAGETLSSACSQQFLGLVSKAGKSLYQARLLLVTAMDRLAQSKQRQL